MRGEAAFTAVEISDAGVKKSSYSEAISRSYRGRAEALELCPLHCLR